MHLGTLLPTATSVSTFAWWNFQLIAAPHYWLVDKRQNHMPNHSLRKSCHQRSWCEGIAGLATWLHYFQASTCTFSVLAQFFEKKKKWAKGIRNHRVKLRRKKKNVKKKTLLRFRIGMFQKQWPISRILKRNRLQGTKAAIDMQMDWYTYKRPHRNIRINEYPPSWQKASTK